MQHDASWQPHKIIIVSLAIGASKLRLALGWGRAVYALGWGCQAASLARLA